MSAFDACHSHTPLGSPDMNYRKVNIIEEDRNNESLINNHFLLRKCVYIYVHISVRIK